MANDILLKSFLDKAYKIHGEKYLYDKMDNIRNEFAQRENLKLIRINYKQYGLVESILEKEVVNG